MEFEIERVEGYALARLQGLAQLEGWQEILPRLGELTTAAKDARLFIDLHGLVGFLGTPERRRVGELAAMHLRHLRRVVIFHLFDTPP